MVLIRFKLNLVYMKTNDINLKNSMRSKNPSLLFSFIFLTISFAGVFYPKPSTYVIISDINPVPKLSFSESFPLWTSGLGGYVGSIDFSPDGNYLVAGVGDKVFLFDLSDSDPINYNFLSGPAYEIAVSSDGNYIAAVDEEAILHLFKKTSGNYLQYLWSYDMGVGYGTDVAISSDGFYIAATSSNKFFLFNRTSSNPMLSKGGSYYDSVAISSNCSYIVTGNNRGEVFLFQKNSSTPIWEYKYTGRVTSVDISSEGDYFVVGSIDKKVYLFERTNPSPLWIFDTGNYVNDVEISKDGNYIVSGGLNKTVHLFNISTLIWKFQTEGSVRSVAFSSDGTNFAVGTTNPENRVYFFEKSSSTPLWSFKADEGVMDVGVTPDGYYIAVGSGKKVFLFSKNINKDLPEITINNPGYLANYSTSSPNFDISISGDYINSTWYTLDSGITNFTFTGLTGKIDQNAWNKQNLGVVWIRFYANNTGGYIGYAEIAVAKVPPEVIAINGYNLIIILGVCAIITLIKIKKRSQ